LPQGVAYLQKGKKAKHEGDKLGKEKKVLTDAYLRKNPTLCHQVDGDHLQNPGSISQQKKVKVSSVTLKQIREEVEFGKGT